MPTLLSVFTPDDVRTDPFPHIVAENVLPEDLVDRLLAAFPADEVVCDGEPPGDNKRFDVLMRRVRTDAAIPAVWREFLEAQSSSQFWADFCRLFGPHVRERYPELASAYGSLEAMQPGVRYVDPPDTRDVFLDAHLSINTPAKRASTVRAPHVDDPLKLYAGLWYLREAGDDTPGGDLLLYRYVSNDRKFFGQQIKEKYVEPVARVPYARNTLIFFLNTPDSLHGVTPRSPSSHTRQFVNLVGEMKRPLFSLADVQENIWLRRLRTYGGPLFQRGYENR
jgi:hypothetical protein